MTVGMESIVNEMKAMYLQDNAEWIVMTSLGKDSTYQLACVWKMLSTISLEDRSKKVHIVTGASHDYRSNAIDIRELFNEGYQSSEREGKTGILPNAYEFMAAAHQGMVPDWVEAYKE